jgi:GT2 family glycosyltransferase
VPGNLSMSAPVVSVVTVNYNLSDEMLASLAGFREQVRSVPCELIVVDNASTDPGRDRLFRQLEAWEGTRLVRLDSNIGFGRACNEGARRASGRFLCFLNPDTRIRANFVPPLLEQFERDPALAVIGPRTNRSRFFDFSAGFQPNLLLELLNVLLIGRWLEAAAVAAASAIAGARPLPVGWVLGACLVARKDAFDRLGGFDEDFFLYFEEVDYCRRVRSAGGKVAYLAGVSVEHAGSITGRRDYEAFTRRFYVGKALFLRKSFTGRRRALMAALLRAQILAQIVLSAALYPLQPDKYGRKIAGGRQALDIAAKLFGDERADAFEHAVGKGR